MAQTGGIVSLTERLSKDRRETDITPIVERRGGTEQRQPRWIEWTRENEKGGKDLTGRVAA